MQEATKVYSKENKELFLSVIPGHFASDRFHVNYYIDMTNLKMRMTNAKMVAETMSKRYISKSNMSSLGSQFAGLAGNLEAMTTMNAVTKPVDTIVCMDGTEVIGSYLAEEFTKVGVHTENKHKTYYVVSPEFDHAGQMVVRDNIKPMINGKHVLVVLASAMSGNTIAKALRGIKSYGGIVEGISVIFTNNVTEVEGHPVYAVFSQEDLPNFKLSDPENCEDCKAGKKLDAIVNSYGYEEL